MQSALGLHMELAHDVRHACRSMNDWAVQLLLCCPRRPCMPGVKARTGCGAAVLEEAAAGHGSARDESMCAGVGRGDLDLGMDVVGVSLGGRGWVRQLWSCLGGAGEGAGCICLHIPGYQQLWTVL